MPPGAPTAALTGSWNWLHHEFRFNFNRTTTLLLNACRTRQSCRLSGFLADGRDRENLFRRAIAGVLRLLDGMGSILPCANDVGWSARRPTGWRWYPFMEFEGF